MAGHGGAGGVGGRSQAWLQYRAWNTAVAEVIYPVVTDPVPAYMDLEDEELARIAAAADYHGTDVTDALALAVQAVTSDRVGRFSLSAVAAETRLWVARNAKKAEAEAPPCLAFLALTVIAAESMGNDEEDIASLAYYARLARLLKLRDDDSALRTQYPRYAEFLWRSLNRWLESLDGERGLPTAYALTYRFVGLPMSQALVRDHDRHRFPLMFAQYGLSPGMRLATEDLVRYVDAWLTAEGSTATANLCRLWNRSDSHERIASIAAVELANWDGAVAGELSVTSGPVAARAMVIASLRSGFMGSSLDLSLGLRPLLSHMDGSMEVLATEGSWLPLGFRPGTAGLWRTDYTVTIDFRSMLEGLVRIRHLGKDCDAQYKHPPRMVIPLIYDDLQSAYVEAERLQLGVDSILLVRSAGTTKFAAGAVEEVEQLLQQSARPGYKKVESIAGLPEGWVLFTDLQLFGAPSTSTRFNEIVPMARNQLTIAGGLRIPSRIRKWSTMSPPEIRATVQSETDLRVTLSGAMGEDEIAEWSSDTGALVASLDHLTLPDGDYQVALFTGKKTPVQQASVRLRSSDQVDNQWESAPRLVYSLDDPLGTLSASEGDLGTRIVDGLMAEGAADVAITVKASNQISWGEPRKSTTVSPIQIGNPDPKSCVVTGAHRIQLPPALGGHAPKFIQGECISCGLVKRYPGWLPRYGGRRGAKNPSSGVSVAGLVKVEDLQTVPDSEVNWDAALDVLMHLGGGAISSLESVALQLEGSALFVDNFVRSLEALGHLSIERNEVGRPQRWEISPSCLGQRADGAYRLAGYWPQSLQNSVRAFVGDHGGDLMEETTGGSPTALFLGGLTDQCAEEFEDESPVTVTPQAGSLILHALRPLSAIAEALPRCVMPGFQSAERFELASAGWLSTGDPYSAGAYRLRRGFETIYVFRSSADVEAGTAAVGPFHLVKHLAANEQGKSILCYLEKSESMLVPQGCDLPGLYGRAVITMAGQLPTVKKVSIGDHQRKVLAYPCVDQPAADLLATLLST
ncbi:MAG: hypothetical protein K0U78_00885 [Actinomycetia bacterium]|nr:hypothetical protein [Actinomycetes bacterium]